MFLIDINWETARLFFCHFYEKVDMSAFLFIKVSVIILWLLIFFLMKTPKKKNKQTNLW